MSFSFIIWILIMVAFTIFVIAANWLIYEKAGKPGWACIIPVYSTLILLEIVGKPWWWLLLMFIPVANLVFAIWMTNLLSKSFGYNEGFTVGLILLPFIFYPIMGFSSVKYKGPAGTEGQAMLM